MIGSDSNNVLTVGNTPTPMGGADLQVDADRSNRSFHLFFSFSGIVSNYELVYSYTINTLKFSCSFLNVCYKYYTKMYLNVRAKIKKHISELPEIFSVQRKS